MIAMLGKDVLEGLVILGIYFDSASDASTFRGLYRAAQELQGAGQVAVSLLMQLALVGAGKGLGAYLKYSRGMKIKSIEEVADDPALKEGGPAVQKALTEARSAGKTFDSWKRSLNKETQAILDDPANAGLKKMWAEMDPAVRRILTRCGSDCIPRNATPAQATQIKAIVDKLGISPDSEVASLLKEYFHSRRDVLQGSIDDAGKAARLEDLEALARQNPVIPPNTPAPLAGRIDALTMRMKLTAGETAMLREYLQVRSSNLEEALRDIEGIVDKRQLTARLRTAAQGRAATKAGSVPPGRGGVYQHAINEHGPANSAEHMMERAKTKPVRQGGKQVGTGVPQGQWYNTDLLVELDQRFPTEGTGMRGQPVDFGRPVGRVFLPDGLVISDVHWVMIIRADDGAFFNAFPILPPGVNY
jgi:hypothetical protein